MSSHSTIDWAEVRRQLEEDERRLQSVLHPSPESAGARLAQRAADLRSRAVKQLDKRAQQVLVFQTGTDRLAIPLSSIREIVPVAHYTTVPGAPRSLVGVHSVRGIIHSLLDPRPKIGGSAVDDSKPIRYALILRHPIMSIGLGATEVERIAEAPPDGLSEGEILSIDGTLATVVDSVQLIEAFDLPAKNST